MERSEAQELEDTRPDMKKSGVTPAEANKSPQSVRKSKPFEEGVALETGSDVDLKGSVAKDHPMATKQTGGYADTNEVKMGEEKAAQLEHQHDDSARIEDKIGCMSLQGISAPFESSRRIENDDNLLFTAHEEQGKLGNSEGVLTRRVSIAKIKKEELFTKVAAWQEARTSELNNRYKREEAKILAWEENQKAKASIMLKKAELRLEQERAKAVEKMQNDIARARKKAEDRKAAAYAEKESKVALLYDEAERIKITRKIPASGCFTGLT
ncbi:hypothetical protein O6H91_17G050400 [Diphasiastrum complanatum]|uniref:Uncharacterized protein n=1 Tax=Diphasiastrum complanatum TaxID=34168 RepID=A0ACC2B6N9_DIPCM|nr:hypothetical protein O6H91_17G050400 [Diphasiastrum complanatum]